MDGERDQPNSPVAGQGSSPRDRPILALVVAGTAITAIATWLISAHDLSEARGQLYNLIIFHHLFARYDAPSSWMALAAVLFAVAIAPFVSSKTVEVPVRWIADHRLLFVLMATAGITTLAPFIYQDYPLAIDEFAAVFQAKIFAAGHIAGQYPSELVQRLVPMPGEFIKISRMTGETMNGQSPFFGALLTPFTLLGLPWIVNPLVAGGTLLLIAYLASRIMPEHPLAPAWAMLLTVASPQFVAYGISYYSMGMHLFLALAYAALFLSPTPARLLLAGLAGGVALGLNNPFPHAVFALPWVIWLASQPGRVRNLAALGLGYLPPVLADVAWMRRVGTLATQEYFPAGTSLPAKYTIASQLRNGAFQFPGVSDLAHLFDIRAMWVCKLALWTVPGLAFVFVLGFRHVRKQPIARLLAWSAVTTWVAYLFVKFDQGHGWGARYFHIVWGIVPLFGAAWLTCDPAGRRWTRYIGLAAAMSLLVLVPQRLMQMREFISEAKSQQPLHDPNAREAVFVDMRPGGGRYWAQDAPRNDPFLRQPGLVFSSKTTDDDAALMAHFFPGSQRLSLDGHGSVWSLPAEPQGQP